MQLKKCTPPLSVSQSINQYPQMITTTKIIVQNKWKHNTKKERSSNQPPQSCCAVLRLHNIYKPQKKKKQKTKPTPYDNTTAPAVLLFCPRCISLKPPTKNYGEAQINNMLLLIYTRRWKYKIEIITVHVQHAGLIFNADFLFSIYIRI